MAVIATIAIVRPSLVRLAVCTAGAAVLLAAFLRPYGAVAELYGMRRSWTETMSFSARPSDWLTSNFHNRTYAALRDPHIDPERWLFPGALSLFFAALALGSSDRKSLKIAGTWMALGFFGSLGLHTVLHRFLFTHVPGFQAIRVPARWAVVAYVGLAILVAIGWELIARRRVWVYIVVGVAFLIELRSAPILCYMAPREIPPVERWIAANKPRAVVELPIAPTTEYGAMLRATVHHRPMVNGVSGFAPPEYVHVRELQWSDAFIPELRRLGVSHAILRRPVRCNGAGMACTRAAAKGNWT